MPENAFIFCYTDGIDGGGLYQRRCADVDCYDWRNASDLAGSITSTYFVVGTVQVGSEFNGSIYIASLYNLAPAASDVLEIYEIGGVVPERFKFGSQASITSGTLTIGKSIPHNISRWNFHRSRRRK